MKQKKSILGLKNRTIKSGKWHKVFLLLLMAVLPVHKVNSQIAGGRMYVVAQKHSYANDANPGTEEQPFRTISKAAGLAGPGDTVLVHDGIYREWVAPEDGGEKGRPLVYMAAPGEHPVISGSEVYNGEWIPAEGHPGVFFTRIPDGFFRTDFNPMKIIFRDSRGGGRQGQVFIEGREMFEARPEKRRDLSSGGEAAGLSRMESMYEHPGTWSTSNGDTLFVHWPSDVPSPGEAHVELSVRRHLFAPVRRAQNYITVNGFIFEHCANDASFPQVGAVSCRSGMYWVIEDNMIRQIKTIGLDCGAENEDPTTIPDILPQDRYRISGHHDIFTLDERRIAGRHLIVNNVVSDCGQCGIAGVFSDGTIIMGNRIERCGSVVPGFETGGIKIHGLMGGTVEGNLVRDNEAWGIWLDCGYIGSRVTRNVVVNNKTSGIFFECSNGPGWIDNNIIASNRGDGIYTHDASGIHIANNLIFNNENFGIYMCVATGRKVPPYYYATGLLENEPSACSWEQIVNNIIDGNRQGAIALPHPGRLAENNFSDRNLFGRGKESPVFMEHFRNGVKRTKEEIQDEAMKAFQQTGDAGLAASDLVMWKDGKGYTMNLSQWQQATGNDRHSRDGDITMVLDTSTFILTARFDEDLLNIDCRPVKTQEVRDFYKFTREVGKDFSAHPMPSGQWLPGAFQSFYTGKNVRLVWPLEYSYPSMPPEVKERPGK